MTTEDADLLKRIEAAIERITSGQAPMRVPVDNTDPDVVLADCFRFVRARLEEAAPQEGKADDERRIKELAGNRFRSTTTHTESDK